MIEIKRLRYAYPGGGIVLRDVSLSVAAGEFVLLAGPSGAGKSTLLRTLNGLVPHFSGGRIDGRVRVNGHDVIAAGPQAMSRQVGFVFQNPEAQAVLDRVEAEIAFGMENAAVPPTEMHARMDEVLDRLELTTLRHRPLITLSGGERQRVAIAAALVLRPRVLVLDEPTSQLDPQAADDVLQTVLRLNKELGLTVILAEHRLERVVPYADRLVVVDDGRIAADDTVRAALTAVEHVPPVVELGRRLGWEPRPLTVETAAVSLRKHVDSDDRKRNACGSFAPQPDTLAPDVSLQNCIRPSTGAWSATRKAERERPSADTEPSPPPKEVLLEVRGAEHAYNGRPVLDAVDLRVRAGEITAVMGRNGAGKTTLLRGIVNLLAWDRGRVWIDGREVSDLSTAEICRTAAYLPQNPDDLLFAETVRAEPAHTLRNHGRAVDDDLIDALLAELGLAAVADAYPRDLSVGQRQRVALAAVMVTRPKLLLLDEPTRGLDYGAKLALARLWRSRRARGMGMVVVTHDVELVAQVADRVVVLADGAVADAGPTAEVLSRSDLFRPQMVELFPGRRWLTVDEVMDGR